MDLWEILGLLGILALWAAIGSVPWFIALVATRGASAPWRLLPVVVIVALGGAALAPVLGLKGWGGFWTSLAAAILLPSAAVLFVSPLLAADRTQSAPERSS